MSIFNRFVIVCNIQIVISMLKIYRGYLMVKLVLVYNSHFLFILSKNFDTPAYLILPNIPISLLIRTPRLFGIQEYPIKNYQFKVHHRGTRKRWCKICSKLAIKTSEQRQ